jgi:hypothetical protein
MKEYYTLEDFKNDPYLFGRIKPREFIKFKCPNCDTLFERIKRGLQPPHKMKEKGYYCTRGCAVLHENTCQVVSCKNCKKIFKKKMNDIKKTNGNNFCTKTCAVTFNNKHKKHGTRRSKLECWLEIKLQEKYTDIAFDFNQKDVINSELDIYCPKLNIAFELNGIFHYKPIYGEKKFQQIQNNDKEKIIACNAAGITLHTLDVSHIGNFSEKSSLNVLNEISKIIELQLLSS